VPESCIVTVTLPPLDVAPPARFWGNGVGAVFAAVNQLARQPATGLPASTMLPPDEATVAAVAERFWWPELGFVIV
jgi:hypothetical protein